MNTESLLMERRMTAPEAVKMVKSGQRVFVSGNASTPFILLDALAERAPELTDVEVVHVLQLGEDPFLRDDLVGCIRHNSLFVGPAERAAVNEGRGFYIPIHLHAIPYLFGRDRFHIDVAMVHTSPPDEHGYLSLGVEVVTSKRAVEVADKVVALVNPRMPRTLGDTFIHLSEVDMVVEHEADLPTLEPVSFGDTEDRIAQIIAAMIPDGATIQMGIGAIPNAVLNRLKTKQDLGIHTEMLTTGMIPLIESGVFTGKHKTINKGKVVCTFAMGTPELYGYRWEPERDISLQELQMISAQLPELERAVLHGIGEPLLNRELPAMIHHLKGREMTVLFKELRYRYLSIISCHLLCSLCFFRHFNTGPLIDFWKPCP